MKASKRIISKPETNKSGAGDSEGSGWESSAAGIFSRIFGPKGSALDGATAEVMTKLTFPPADHERINVLSAKARAGTLTAQETAELDSYGLVSNLIGIMQSRARLALGQQLPNQHAELANGA
jgi:hypothetical protein